MTEKDLEDFSLLHAIARNALTLMKCHPCAEPGFKGLIEEFDDLCEGTLEAYQRPEESRVAELEAKLKSLQKQFDDYVADVQADD
jgi:hypothetical protein